MECEVQLLGEELRWVGADLLDASLDLPKGDKGLLECLRGRAGRELSGDEAVDEVRVLDVGATDRGDPETAIGLLDHPAVLGEKDQRLAYRRDARPDVVRERSQAEELPGACLAGDDHLADVSLRLITQLRTRVGADHARIV